MIRKVWPRFSSMFEGAIKAPSHLGNSPPPGVGAQNHSIALGACKVKYCPAVEIARLGDCASLSLWMVRRCHILTTLLSLRCSAAAASPRWPGSQFKASGTAKRM